MLSAKSKSFGVAQVSKIKPAKRTEAGGGFKLFAVFGMEAPKELISRHDDHVNAETGAPSEQQYYCHFNMPLPEHIVLFGTGDWPLGNAKVEVMLGTVKKIIGTVSASAASFCAQPQWTRAEQEKGAELAAAARVAKVVVRISVGATDATATATATASGHAATAAVVAAGRGKAKGKRASTGGSQRGSKRKSTDGHTGRRTSTASNAANKATLTAAATAAAAAAAATSVAPTTQAHSAEWATGTPEASSNAGGKGTAAAASGATTAKSSGKGKGKGKAGGSGGASPSPRWGHSMDMVSATSFVVFGGQGENQDLSKGLWAGAVMAPGGVNATKSCAIAWETEQAMELMKGVHAPMTRTGHSSAFDPDSGCLHIFGGAKKKRFFSDIHTLEIATNTWTSVKPTGGGVAPTCSYHSMNFHRGELFVFGGVYPEPDPTPDTCSNTLHIFSFAQKNWYKPSIVGDMPCARSGHSATLVEDELVIFGGWDMPAVFNDVFVMDMTLLECAKLDGLGGTAPHLRSWHAATMLPIAGTRCVLVHGGFDGEEVMGDAHVLDLDNKKWVDVSATIGLSARAGHTAVVSDDGLSVLFFGGGDNEGTFFNEVTSVSTANIAAAIASDCE